MLCISPGLPVYNRKLNLATFLYPAQGFRILSSTLKLEVIYLFLPCDVSRLCKGALFIILDIWYSEENWPRELPGENWTWLGKRKNNTLKRTPAEAPTISTGLLALWLERLTPDNEDLYLSLAGQKFMRQQTVEYPSGHVSSTLVTPTWMSCLTVWHFTGKLTCPAPRQILL